MEHQNCKKRRVLPSISCKSYTPARIIPPHLCRVPGTISGMTSSRVNARFAVDAAVALLVDGVALSRGPFGRRRPAIRVRRFTLPRRTSLRRRGDIGRSTAARRPIRLCRLCHIDRPSTTHSPENRCNPHTEQPVTPTIVTTATCLLCFDVEQRRRNMGPTCGNAADCAAVGPVRLSAVRPCG